MPATFGSGTAGCDQGAGQQPILLGSTALPAGETLELFSGQAQCLVILTAIDVVSDGGSGSGFTTVGLDPGSGPVPFWSFNEGSNTDTFEWRGWLVVPHEYIVQASNVGTIDCNITCCGLLVPDYRGV